MSAEIVLGNRGQAARIRLVALLVVLFSFAGRVPGLSAGPSGSGLAQADSSPPDSTRAGTDLPDSARASATPAGQAAADSAAGVVVVYERELKEPPPEPGTEHKILSDTDMHLGYRIEDREGKRLRLDLQPRYDRVDELSIAFSQSIEHGKKPYPRLVLREVLSTGRDEILYRLDFEQPIFSRERLTLGAALFDETAIFTDLEGRVGDGENTLAALFFREDFRNYHSREGFTLSLRARSPRGPEASIEYADQEDAPLPVATQGSVFRPRSAFRGNPPADEGRLRSWRFSLGFGRTSGRRESGLIQRHQATYEYAGPRTGSRFQFERWLLESRFGLRLGPDQDVVIRLRGGGVVSGELPDQRLFYLGGIGTLRARDYAEFVGERSFIANIEYGFTIFGQIQAVLFQDIGAAWMRPRDLQSVRPEIDAGLAFRNRTGRFRLNLARDLRGERKPVVVTVRLSQPF